MQMTLGLSRSDLYPPTLRPAAELLAEGRALVRDWRVGQNGFLDETGIATPAALVAGTTAIGNLGQYFTFRLPYWDDDIATTEATVTALGLIAAQDVEILVHSNLDDGFAG